MGDVSSWDRGCRTHLLSSGHWPDKFIMNESLNTYGLMRGMLITTEQIGTKIDENRVVYFDLPLLRKTDATVLEGNGEGTE